MNLHALSDSSLILNTQKYVREEREILTQLLHHFREIEKRKLYCDYKYSSLHKMLVGHFGYSDDEAYRRTSAMKLLKELPEVEEKINEGKLSLSHLGLAQKYFREEQKTQLVTKELKLSFINEISSQSIRDAQRTAYSKSSYPESLKPAQVKVVTDSKVEVRFVADKSMEHKIEELKGLLAHTHPNISLSELFTLVCDMGIQTLKVKKTKLQKFHKIKNQNQFESRFKSHYVNQSVVHISGNSRINSVNKSENKEVIKLSNIPNKNSENNVQKRSIKNLNNISPYTAQADLTRNTKYKTQYKNNFTPAISTTNSSFKTSQIQNPIHNFNSKLATYMKPCEIKTQEIHKSINTDLFEMNKENTNSKIKLNMNHNHEQNLITSSDLKSPPTVQRISNTLKTRAATHSNTFSCENCHSKYALEVDHIYPKSKGGCDNSNNLRILCKACNQRSAVKHFGIQKMQTYLK